MPTTIDYSKLEEPAKSQKAIQDIIEFVGEKRYKKIVEAITGQPKRDIIVALSLFQGIEGFPAQVLADRYGAPESEAPNE